MEYTKDWNYTEVMQERVKDKMELVPSFYSREDLQEAIFQVKNADRDSRYFCMEALADMCENLHLDPQRLLENPELLKEVPKRNELKEKMLETLYTMYQEFPDSTDYISRMVNRLVPEYGNHPTRTAILKKFVSECPLKCKTLKMEGIYQWTIAHFNEEEKKKYDSLNKEQQRYFISEKITDSIFINLKTELTNMEMLGLIVKRMEKIISDPDEYYMELKDDTNKKQMSGVADIIFSEDTAGKIKRFFSENGIVFDDSAQNLQNMKVLLKLDDEKITEELYASILKDFKEQLRVIKRKSKGDAPARLFKTDQRDERKKKNSRWGDTLQICDDIASGNFRSNGKTRTQLYYFAMMFDMTISSEYDFDEKRDIEKNLFHDYYCDNFMRFLRKDASIGSEYEKEPSGAGINYKNYFEALLIYYIFHKETAKTAGERLDKAVKTADACRKAGNQKVYLELEESEERTIIYKENILEQLLEQPESQLVDFITHNYRVISEDNINAARITVSDEENTAFETLSKIIEDTDNMTEMTPFEMGYGLSFDEYEDIELQEIKNEVKASGDVSFKWDFLKALAEKYKDDTNFCMVISHMEERLKDNRINKEPSELIRAGYVLQQISKVTEKQYPVTRKTLEKNIKKYIPIVTEGKIKESLEFLMEIGFGVESKKDGAIFLLKEKKNQSFPDSESAEDINIYNLSKLLYESLSLGKLQGFCYDKDILWQSVLEKAQKQHNIEDLSNYDLEECLEFLHMAGYKIAFEDAYCYVNIEDLTEEHNQLLNKVAHHHSLDEKEILKLVRRLEGKFARFDKHVKRTKLISASVDNYVNAVLVDATDPSYGIWSFPELYDDFKQIVDMALVEARYQTISEKNIFDMIVVFSLYYYLMEQM